MRRTPHRASPTYASFVDTPPPPGREAVARPRLSFREGACPALDEKPGRARVCHSEKAPALPWMKAATRPASVIPKEAPRRTGSIPGTRRAD
jgi:hypothetical protein